MSKLIDMKLAYLESDIRQNLSSVIENYAAFAYDVNEADKRAFTNFEFKLLLERLEQIRKDGTTKVAETDAAAPKLGHRTAIPYPEGGIVEGINIGSYEDHTLGSLLDEHLEDDIHNFYIFKERSSSFINTLLQVTDLQAATLEDFEKLNCSKEITKMMKPLSPVGEGSSLSLTFYVENYLKEDDAVYINDPIRDNVENNIHEAVIEPLFTVFNTDEETFKIANGIQPFASTLPVPQTILAYMQVGNGVEIELSDGNTFRAIGDDTLASLNDTFSAEKAKIEQAFDSIQWFKEYLANRHEESEISEKITTLASNSTPPTPPTDTPEDNPTAWRNYESALAAYQETMNEISSLCTNLNSVEGQLDDEEINKNREYLVSVLNEYGSGINDREAFPEGRQTRIITEFSNAQTGQYTLSLADLYPADDTDITCILAKSISENTFVRNLKDFTEVNKLLSYALTSISKNAFKTIYDTLDPDVSSSNPNYSKFISGLKDTLTNLRSKATTIATEETRTRNTVKNSTLQNTNEAYNNQLIESLSSKFEELIEETQAMLESLPATPISLDDLAEYCKKTLPNHYEVLTFADRGVINITYQAPN